MRSKYSSDETVLGSRIFELVLNHGSLLFVLGLLPGCAI